MITEASKRTPKISEKIGRVLLNKKTPRQESMGLKVTKTAAVSSKRRKQRNRSQVSAPIDNDNKSVFVPTQSEHTGHER